MEFLEDKWESLSIKSIAQKLDRTENAIISKAQKIGLRRSENKPIPETYVSFNFIQKYLGYATGSAVKERLLKLGLPTTFKKVKNSKRLVVNIDEFWKWAYDNKKKLNFAKITDTTTMNIPKWAIKKIESDRLNPAKRNRNRPWTKYESNLLIAKTKSNRYTYTQLSKEFDRTENAIKRQLINLKVPYRPIPRDYTIKWTEEENKKLLELHKEGYDSFYIAKQLNKTELSIADRVRILSAKDLFEEVTD